MSRSPKRSIRALLGAELRGLAAATTFLTRVPAGSLALTGEDVARAGWAFPLVGAGIGAVVGAIVLALASWLTPLLAVGLALAVAILLTGALHIDGLADSADALGASTRERALEIMREHTVGAFGATAIALDLLVRAAALFALQRHGDVLRFAIVAGTTSRAVPVLLAAFLPYARPGGGAGAALTHGQRWRAIAAAVIAAGVSLAVAGMAGLVITGCAGVAALGLGTLLQRWLAGVTGDTLGAAVELSEMAALVMAVALVPLL